MSDIFADTSGWASLLDPSQQYHTIAAAIYRSERLRRRRFVTSNYILTELVALLTSPLRFSRPAIVAVIEDLRASPHVRIVHVDTALDREAWQLLRSRQDKNWSLADCSSFVIMQQHNLIDALTTDQHFEQAGFVRLLK
jgi:predicted nucleic acid-binding protein